MNSKHYLSLSLFSLLLLALMSSCIEEEDEIMISNPKSEVYFEYSMANTDDDSSYKVYSSDVIRRSSSWLGFGDWGGDLEKSIHFTAKSGSGDTLSIAITQRGSESNRELLELRDEDKNYWERSWNYKSTETEIQNFWYRPGGYISINGTYFKASRFEVVSAKSVFVDGVEKTYLEIRFSGEAFGFYDPYKQYPGYIIKNGRFRGVIE